MKKIVSLVILSTAIALSGCTDNQRVKVWGGTATKELPVNQKLVNVTWKEGNDLWVLTRPMRNDEGAETYTFKEDSSVGVMEGTVIINEHRSIVITS